MDTLHNSPQWRTTRIDDVKPYPGRARTHDKKQTAKLEKLIKHYGQIAPIIIDGVGVIIDGHAVWEIMKTLGYDEIAVVVVETRTDDEIKALRLALNRIASDAGWDNETLRADFELFVAIGFDLELTGFDAVEIDALIDVDVPKLNVTEDEEQIPAPRRPAVSAAGDVWSCGRHRIGCGDARDQSFVDKLLAGDAQTSALSTRRTMFRSTASSRARAAAAPRIRARIRRAQPPNSLARFSKSRYAF